MKKFLGILAIFLMSSVSNFGYAQPAEDTSPSSDQAAPMQTQTNDDTQTNNATQPSDTTQTNETMQTSDTSQTETKNSVDDTKMAMRKLWEDHISWTRNYIISAIAGLRDIDAVTNRLLQNQDDIGNAIKPYYGDDAGNQLAKLLRDHIMIATKVVKAAKANNKAAFDKAQKEWSKNADDIATFLSSANPNWNKQDLLDALQMHLDLTTKEAASRLHKNWSDDIKAYDENEDHMLTFSDTLVDGIAKQFPAKFSE